MRLKIKDVPLFTNLMKTLNTVTDEATFHIKAEGISMRSMDPSRTCMVDFELHKESFEEYEVEEATDITFSIEKFLQLLKRAAKTDALEVSTVKPKLRVALIGEKDFREFLMNTLESETDEAPLPKLTFNVKAKVVAEAIETRIEDAKMATDHAHFIADPEKITIEAKGDFIDSNSQMSKGSNSLLDLEIKEPSKAIYSLTVLSDIFKGASEVADLVTMEYSTDQPLKLLFQLTPLEQGKLVYYLAPRIEVD
jgi:proliferating cell nuclear antigen